MKRNKSVTAIILDSVTEKTLKVVIEEGSSSILIKPENKTLRTLLIYLGQKKRTAKIVDKFKSRTYNTISKFNQEASK